MAAKWDTVHVFISSTFNDMHAERDLLVKQVFPRLAEWCERRKLRLVDVDLRWGVTEVDATNNRGVVETCLRKIDECRPFFVALLGQRYGWVPRREDVPDETVARFPGVEDELSAGASVTELEILHAVARPFQSHDGVADERMGAADHAFFYVRDPSYLDQMPHEPALLRRTYTDEAEPVESARRFLLEKRGQLHASVLPGTNRPVRRYEARWNDEPGARTAELALPLTCPATLAVNQDRWRRQWQDHAGVSVRGLDVAEDPEQAERARAFNEKLTAGRLGAFSCESEPLGDVILRDLQRGIAARFPEHVETVETSELERELDAQDAFRAAAASGFVERPGVFDALDAYAEAAHGTALLLLRAPSGMGKSALLARWIERRPAHETICFRFIGASDRSTTVHSLLSSLLGELTARGRLTVAIPRDPLKLREAFPRLLGSCEGGRIVLVLDALNQLDTGLRELDWLPRALPPKVRLVVSFKTDDPAAASAAASILAGGAIAGEVVPFDSLDDRRALVRAFLSQYLKELEAQHLEALIHASGAHNPLFLKIALAELRVFGAFDKIASKVSRDLGDTPVSAFRAVLGRLAGDAAHTVVPPGMAVPFVFGLLAHARNGLPVRTLSRSLCSEAGLDASRVPDAEETVHTLLRQVRQFLARREGRADFFYESFQLAARGLYAGASGSPARQHRTSERWHRLLAADCAGFEALRGIEERYALGSLVWHHLAAGDVGLAARALTSFPYLMRRLQVFGVEEVARIELEYAETEGRPGCDATPGFAVCRRFFGDAARLLLRSLPEWPCHKIFLQLAWEHADDSPFTEGAQRWLEEGRCDWIWLRARNRPAVTPPPACLAALDVGYAVVDMTCDAGGRAVVALTGEYLGYRNSIDRFHYVVGDLRTNRIKLSRVVDELEASGVLRRHVHGLLARRVESGVATDLEKLVRDDPAAAAHEPGFPQSAKELGREINRRLVAFYNPELTKEPLLLLGDGMRIVAGTHDGVVRTWALQAARRLLDVGLPDDPFSRTALDREREEWQNMDMKSLKGTLSAGFRVLQDEVQLAGEPGQPRAIWYSGAPLVHPDFDNCLVTAETFVRSLLTDLGLAIETTGGRAILLEVVRGSRPLLPDERRALATDALSWTPVGDFAGRHAATFGRAMEHDAAVARAQKNHARQMASFGDTAGYCSAWSSGMKAGHTVSRGVGAKREPGLGHSLLRVPGRERGPRKGGSLRRTLRQGVATPSVVPTLPATPAPDFRQCACGTDLEPDSPSLRRFLTLVLLLVLVPVVLIGVLAGGAYRGIAIVAALADVILAARGLARWNRERLICPSCGRRTWVPGTKRRR